MGYTDINGDNISSAIRENFRAVIESIEDPKAGKNRKMVYEREPHVKASGFDGYPIIILEDYSATDTDETVNGNHVLWEGSCSIRIQADEDNPQNLDKVSDEIYLLKGSKYSQPLGEQGISAVTIESDDREIGINEKENFIFERGFTINFRMKVSMDG